MELKVAPPSILKLISEEHCEAREAIFGPLSFYKDGFLAIAKTTMGEQRFVLGNAMGMTMTVMLDGNSAQIKMANRVGGLKLTRENAGEYAWFYCGNLTAKHGRFNLVEKFNGLCLDTGHVPKNMKIRVGCEDADGYRVGAYSQYGNDLFRVSMKVFRYGAVDMLRDQHLGEIQTVQ